MSVGEPNPCSVPLTHNSVTLSTTMSNGTRTPNRVSASAHGLLAAPRRTVLTLILSADHSRSADSRTPGPRWPGRAAGHQHPEHFLFVLTPVPRWIPAQQPPVAPFQSAFRAYSRPPIA